MHAQLTSPLSAQSPYVPPLQRALVTQLSISNHYFLISLPQRDTAHLLVNFLPLWVDCWAPQGPGFYPIPPSPCLLEVYLECNRHSLNIC